ncbi:nuclear receptor 2C2-associated protein [Blastocystis sp. subtype 4]|uniref:nuclear receptor 2C2-associated protein n=1 Tax=Blastocystis sp. subtype 4 TaxID=944170 RepID=UPI000711995F|nr:nuclear receptor 2C2-associated protein [Blastocystis sp. subtype 4]KNB43576.1 nuclear receptor 2C2-associated protein [Blastocystis sp. subtype 4]|eukprot:XP_014527019.1 nuclear receptor 2C2-associated protein [Blastocystis sp. subtype 4]
MEIVPVKVVASSEGKHENRIRRAKCVLDSNELTFWFSDKTLPQHLIFTFNEPTSVSSIEVTFQGGFASESIVIYGSEDGVEFSSLSESLYVENSNIPQIFSVSCSSIRYMKLEFLDSYDLYSRLIVYSVRFFQ